MWIASNRIDGHIRAPTAVDFKHHTIIAGRSLITVGADDTNAAATAIVLGSACSKNEIRLFKHFLNDEAASHLL